MAEAGGQNMGAFVRKMALNGYVLHVDLGPVRELVAKIAIPAPSARSLSTTLPEF